MSCLMRFYLYMYFITSLILNKFHFAYVFMHFSKCTCTQEFSILFSMAQYFCQDYWLVTLQTAFSDSSSYFVLLMRISISFQTEKENFRMNFYLYLVHYCPKCVQSVVKPNKLVTFMAQIAINLKYIYFKLHTTICKCQCRSRIKLFTIIRTCSPVCASLTQVHFQRYDTDQVKSFMLTVKIC